MNRPQPRMANRDCRQGISAAIKMATYTPQLTNCQPQTTALRIVIAAKPAT